jgi:hypothetical protein
MKMAKLEELKDIKTNFPRVFISKTFFTPMYEFHKIDHILIVHLLFTLSNQCNCCADSIVHAHLLDSYDLRW